MKKLLIAIFYILNIEASDRPDWINDVSKICAKSEMCTVGSGHTREDAIANANNEIAKIFENNISSNFTLKLSSEGSDLSDSISEDIQQVTNTTLQGVEIKKIVEDKDTVYALASLNKMKAGLNIKKEIEQIDDKIQALYKLKNISSLVQVEGELVKRNILELRYHFLTNLDFKSNVSLEEIYKLKNELIKKIIIHVSFESKECKELEQSLAKNLTDLGYKVTRGKKINPKATHIVHSEYSSEKQFMKVEGFVKYSYELKISISGLNNVNSSELDLIDVESGRNEFQARSKAFSSLKEQLKEKMISLKIE